MNEEQSYEEYQCEQADRMMEQMWYEEHKLAEDKAKYPLFYLEEGIV